MYKINENITVSKAIPPNRVQRFVKVPKEIILAKELPEHRTSLFLYFNYNQTWDEMVHYSPLYMIHWSGYKTSWSRSNKNNIYIKFKTCMQWYFENGYIIDFDEDKFIQSTFQSSLLNKEKINPLNNFGILYDFEIETINKFDSPYKPLNKSVLLSLLSYIRAFTWFRSNEVSGHSNKSQKEKPEIFHSQFQTMEHFTGIPYKLISRSVSVLEDMGLIKTYRMPRYKDSNGNWRTDDIIFVCPYKYTLRDGQIIKCSNQEYDSEKELLNGIEFVKNQKYSSKKFYQD